MTASSTCPPGIRRIKADQDPIAAIGGDGGRVDADVAMLDSGIAIPPDLAIAGGINCTDTGGRSAWGDALGHGTHVAGIIGALDNGIGVVGVAPGVRLWSVKIIGDDDHGYVSWAGAAGSTGWRRPRMRRGTPRFEAANMSVGGELLYPDTPCGQGHRRRLPPGGLSVVAAGIPVVAARRQQRRDADDYRPSAYDEAITVSALADFDGAPGRRGAQADICPWYAVDRDDTFADFSDFGPAVDLIAPGKCIFSTYTRGRYAWMSGTEHGDAPCDGRGDPLSPALSGCFAGRRSKRRCGSRARHVLGDPHRPRRPARSPAGRQPLPGTARVQRGRDGAGGLPGQ